MNDTNVAIISGNLARDPDIRSVGTNGTSLATFTVACNIEWIDRDGELKKKTDYVSCQAWGGWADKIASYRKGTPVYVTGKNVTRSWDDRTTGKKTYKQEVSVQSITTIAREKSQGGGQGRSTEPRPAPAGKSDHSANADSQPDFGSDDDIPF